MINKMAEIRAKEGKTNTNIILIAPHGHKDDDENTGKLTRAIRNKLDCHAVINEVYRKPKQLEDGKTEEPNVENKILDLNNKPHAEKHKKFLEKIKTFITDADTHVFWIHGIKDENLDAEATEMGTIDIKGLIGYGQPDRHSITVEKAQTLLDNLKAAKFEMAFTKDDAGNYRGWSQDNMNQWFRHEQNGYTGVQSIQLEFAFSGVRDVEDSINISSQAIANAISELVGAKPVPEQEAVADTELVESACTHVRGLINDNNAMLKVGQYLIETFYAGNYDWAREKKRFKNQSLIAVINKLNEEGYAPAKTWFYNAVKLAVDEYDFKDFRTYGEIGHSHKVYLTHVEKFEDKKKLIDATVDNKYTVKDLRAEISKLKDPAQKRDNIRPLPDIEKVKKMDAEKQAKKIETVKQRKSDVDGMIQRLTDDLKKRKKEQKACKEWLEGIEKYLGQVAVGQMEKSVNSIREDIASKENESSDQSNVHEAAMANEAAKANSQTMSEGV